MRSLLTIIILFLSQTILAQNSLITPKKQKEIKDYIKYFESKNQLIGTISIFENDKEVIRESFGEMNKPTEVSCDKMYPIGSITKLFVAVVFAKLNEKNRIDFNEKLKPYFPEIPNADKIKIKHLLNHTSGLGDYVSKGKQDPYWLREPHSEKEIMDEIISQGVSFKPGSSLKYSNSAYYLLGKILEKKYQKPFHQIIADEIITPLHLKNTLVITPNTDTHQVVNSYELVDGKWIEIEDFYLPNISSAGGIVSTSHDLNVFLNHLFAYDIIDKKTLDKMLPKNKHTYGLGIMEIPFYKKIGYGHGGDTIGVHSITSYFPEDNLSLAIIINGANYPTNDFAIGLLSIIYDKNFTLPDFKVYHVDKSLFKIYEGVYGADDFPINIKVFSEDGILKAQGDGQPAFNLTPIEQHFFEFPLYKIKIKFKPSESTLILYQDGRKSELKRIRK